MQSFKDTALYTALVPYLNGKDPTITRNCIHAVTSLPGLQNWVPAVLNDLVARRILSWGLPLALLSDVSSLGPLRRKLASAVLKNDAPDASDVSEIAGAGLVRVLDGNLTRVPAAKVRKTPDFVAEWSGEKVDLEITRADEKAEHVRRANAAKYVTRDCGYEPPYTTMQPTIGAERFSQLKYDSRAFCGTT